MGVPGTMKGSLKGLSGIYGLAARVLRWVFPCWRVVVVVVVVFFFFFWRGGGFARFREMAVQNSIGSDGDSLVATRGFNNSGIGVRC